VLWFYNSALCERLALAASLCWAACCPPPGERAEVRVRQRRVFGECSQWKVSRDSDAVHLPLKPVKRFN